ncbi:hypothetical protein [Oerskovia flava]|uniref:hypothetical protein n=1 Tax=Oerskovia flava TaxID=2986422 RepID=UPI0022404730|nr:hypothetical protein [Oerskovia sp. JB1-3-2]
MGNPYAPPQGDAPPRPRPGTGPVDQPPAGGPPPPPAQQPSPQPAPRPGPPEPPPADPEEARVATRRVVHFGLLLLLVIILSALPFPWQLASLAVAVAALVVGVRALRAVWRARVRGALAPAVVIGVVLTSIMALQMIMTLATWDIAITHQRCLDGAITVSATDRCEAARDAALQEWLTNVTPTAPGS